MPVHSLFLPFLFMLTFVTFAGGWEQWTPMGCLLYPWDLGKQQLLEGMPEAAERGRFSHENPPVQTQILPSSPYLYQSTLQCRNMKKQAGKRETCNRNHGPTQSPVCQAILLWGNGRETQGSPLSPSHCKVLQCVVLSQG